MAIPHAKSGELIDIGPLGPPVATTATHSDSVGLPCPGAHIIVVDAAGREVPRGEVGELWIHGGSVIKGYWNNPRATAESFTAGYWHSGDLGSIDEQNFVRVFDRQKDMINRGGLKIYSAEVESVLAGHPAVIESAIVARPSGSPAAISCQGATTSATSRSGCRCFAAAACTAAASTAWIRDR